VVEGTITTEETDVLFYSFAYNKINDWLLRKCTESPEDDRSVHQMFPKC